MADSDQRLFIEILFDALDTGMKHGTKCRLVVRQCAGGTLVNRLTRAVASRLADWHAIRDIARPFDPLDLLAIRRFPVGQPVAVSLGLHRKQRFIQ